MKEHKNFWDRNAGRYDRFMRKDRAAYEEMYKLIRPVVKAKTVLELATGTGLIAKHIVNAAAHIEATDASAEMIAEAKRDNHSAKLHFSVQDMFRLPYADKSFDVVIVSNALHIVPQPEKALQEIKRVLKEDCVLIAPTFTHAGNSFSGKVKAFFMKLAGFPLHSRWTSEEYLRFLRQNGWTVRKSAVLKASFPLTYSQHGRVSSGRRRKRQTLCASERRGYDPSAIRWCPGSGNGNSDRRREDPADEKEIKRDSCGQYRSAVRGHLPRYRARQLHDCRGSFKIWSH